jgi:hypothetical protein
MKPLWCIEKNNMYAKAHDDAVKAFAKKKPACFVCRFLNVSIIAK